MTKDIPNIQKLQYFGQKVQVNKHEQIDYDRKQLLNSKHAFGNKLSSLNNSEQHLEVLNR